MTIEERAERARVALSRYRHAHDIDEVLEEVIPDLIADIMHYAKSRDLDPYATITRASDYYTYEVEHPEED